MRQTRCRRQQHPLRQKRGTVANLVGPFLPRSAGQGRGPGQSRRLSMFRANGAAWRKAKRQPCEPRSEPGSCLGDRPVPDRCARRSRRASRGLCARTYRHNLPRTATAEGQARWRGNWPAEREAVGRFPTIMSLTLPAAIGAIVFQQQGHRRRPVVPDRGRDADHHRCRPKHLGARIGLTAVHRAASTH